MYIYIYIIYIIFIAEEYFQSILGWLSDQMKLFSVLSNLFLVPYWIACVKARCASFDKVKAFNILFFSFDYMVTCLSTPQNIFKFS